MIQDLTKYVDFLAKHEITPKQFLLCYCLVLDKLDKPEGGRIYREKAGANRPIANLYKYAQKVERWTLEEVDYLEEKGFIVNKGDRKQGMGEGYFPDNLVVTPKFINLIFTDLKDFEEFWSTYPSFVSNFSDPLYGPKVPLKAVSQELIEEIYNKKVESKVIHSRMMRVLRWAVEEGQINLRIDKFLESKYWEQLEELMDGDFESEKTRGKIL